MAVLQLDDTAAAQAAGVHTKSERLGLAIGHCDLLIAGHPRSRGLALITGNRREFNRVKGLWSEDWLREAERR
jgi:tRNA(fMet)-specific endonuclease VapC